MTLSACTMASARMAARTGRTGADGPRCAPGEVTVLPRLHRPNPLRHVDRRAAGIERMPQPGAFVVDDGVGLQAVVGSTSTGWLVMITDGSKDLVVSRARS